MTRTTSPTTIHASGVVAACIAGLAGYFFGYDAMRLGDERLEALRHELSDREATLAALPPVEPEPEPVAQDAPEILTLTPTAFLATIELLARESELSVKRSRRLEQQPTEDAPESAPGVQTAAGPAPLARLEVVGEGRYTDVIAFFERLDERLTPLEIRSVRLTSLPSGAVEWGMICVNHTGRAGGG